MLAAAGILLGFTMALAVWAHRQDEIDRKAQDQAEEAEAEAEVGKKRTSLMLPCPPALPSL